MRILKQNSPTFWSKWVPWGPNLSNILDWMSAFCALRATKACSEKPFQLLELKGLLLFVQKTRTHMILFPSLEGDDLSKINEEITTTQKIKEEIKTALASGVPYLLNQKRWRQKIRGKKWSCFASLFPDPSGWRRKERRKWFFKTSLKAKKYCQVAGPYKAAQRAMPKTFACPLRGHGRDPYERKLSASAPNSKRCLFRQGGGVGVPSSFWEGLVELLLWLWGP